MPKLTNLNDTLVDYTSTLEYDDDEKETLHVARSNLVFNHGLYFFSLNKKLGNTLKRVRFDLPSETEGLVSVQACRKLSH